MAKNKNKKARNKQSNKMSIRDVGQNMSLSELMKITRSSGNRDPLAVMAKALNKGVGLGRKVVNAYNTPGGLGNYRYQGTPDSLIPLKGLNLGKRQVYQGASSYETPSGRTVNGGYYPGSITYSPIIGLRKPKSQKNNNKGDDLNITEDVEQTDQTMGETLPMDNYGGDVAMEDPAPENPMSSQSGYGSALASWAAGWRGAKSARRKLGIAAQGLASQRLNPTAQLVGI